MRKAVAVVFLCASGLLAQTAVTVPFLVSLSPANETPAIAGLNATGTAMLLVHAVRDASGKVTSGSVDFSVDYSFPGEVTFTGLHIHSGAAGVAGPVTVNTGLSAGSPVSDPGGRGNITRQAQVTSDNTAGLSTLEGLLQNPANYYVNLHSTVNPGGAIRGQVLRTDARLLLAQLSSANEVPAVNLDASGLASVLALRGFDSSNNTAAAAAIFNVDYRFPAAVTMTGLHIHSGAAGANGPVRIDTGLTAAAPLQSDPSGTGSLSRTATLALTNTAGLSVLHDLFNNPGNYYVNLHTTVNPAGVFRGQLHNTDVMEFPVLMTTANEVPPLAGLTAQAPALFRVWAMRNADGTVAAARVAFDVNHRFPGAASFTGLHIHNGSAGENGPVTINSAISAATAVASETGSGNIYREAFANSDAALAAVNSLVVNPERHYINLHTAANPAGAIRAQLAAANTALPAVGAVISAVSDPGLRTLAPGGLMTIFGSNFSKAPVVVAGVLGTNLPLAVNGVEVTVGGQKAPIFVANADYLVAQVPFEVQPGTVPLTVKTANGDSAALNVSIAASAPALFFDAVGGLVVQNATGLLVRPENAARAGDILLLYSTGLGQTTSNALSTGKMVAYPPGADTVPVTVSIGGRTARVIYSLASPGFVGLYQTAIEVPAGLTPGNVALSISAGGVTSNVVNLAVR